MSIFSEPGFIEFGPDSEYELPPYYRILEIAREEMERHYPDFPLQRCSISARLVSMVTGLEEVAGWYSPLCDSIDHAWNRDLQQGWVYDITNDQFKKHDRKITVLKRCGRMMWKSGYLTREQKEAEFEEEATLVSKVLYRYLTEGLV